MTAARLDAPDWYDRWVDRYRRAALLGDDWLYAALDWWGTTFGPLDATEAELDAAVRGVRALPSDARPRYPGDHLPEVAAALGRVRDEANARQKAARDREYIESVDAVDGGGVLCPDKCDRGLIEVPRAEWFRGGVFKEYKYGPTGRPLYHRDRIPCRCLVGVREGAKLNRPGLAEYERAHPGWRPALARADALQWPGRKGVPHDGLPTCPKDWREVVPHLTARTESPLIRAVPRPTKIVE